MTARTNETRRIILRRTPTRSSPHHRPLQPIHEFRIVADDLRVLARKVDALIEAYGEYINANTPGEFDRSLFKEQLFGALDGNALYEIEQASQQLREDNAEQAYYARHNHIVAE